MAFIYSPKYEEVDTKDMDCLDTTSRTSIIDFMRMFAEDSSFTPPESSMIFDSDIDDDISIDSEVPGLDYDFEDVYEDQEKRARAN